MRQLSSILHVGKFYHPHPGGMETHLRSLVAYQSAQASVEVLVSSTDRRTRTELRDGAVITRLATLGSIASMPITPSLFGRLRGRSDDILHLHMPNPAAALAYLLSGHPGKLVLTHHGDTTGRRVLRAFSDPFVRLTMKRASAIIVCSQRYLDSSEELQDFRGKCRVIPLGIDLDCRPPVNEEQVQQIRTRYGSNIILGIGRLVPYKGFDILIRAIRGTNATLLLIGDGPMLAQLRETAAEAGVSSRTHFLGYVHDLAPYYHAARAFVLASVSRAESFGLVQLEAMAAGLPVINTDLPSAVPEVSLHGVTGFTVPPRDEKALSLAIEMLLQNDTLREQYARAARVRAATFSGSSTYEKVSRLYEEILNAPASRLMSRRASTL